MPEQELEFQDAMLSSREPAPQDPPAPFDEIEREQATLLSTPLKDTVDTRTLEFILGRRPMSEWDAFLGELQAKGLDTYLDLVNTALPALQRGPRRLRSPPIPLPGAPDDGPAISTAC